MKRSTVVTYFLAVAGLLTAAPPVFAHEESTKFVSQLRGVSPTVAGLGMHVVGRDEAMRLTNGTGKTVFVPGYDGEPYLRLLPSGKVEMNVNSPARYLNQDRFAQTAIPKGVSGKARPVWRRVARDGAFVWHDHRIHWMGKATPPQVKDEARRTKIFDWKVPILVGQRRVQAIGTLYWDPVKEPVAAAGKFNVVPYAIGGLLLAAALAVIGGLLLRRRQRGGDSPDAEATAESW
ncbi:MAG: hypothetical protein QOE13_1171 [Gaiellaceae bacterium]|nr:hypothetical protein [Gaiellaceae bacterium]